MRVSVRFQWLRIGIPVLLLVGVVMVLPAWGQVTFPLRGLSDEIILGLGAHDMLVATYSPDGRYVAAAGSIAAFLWEAQSGTLTRVFMGHTRPVRDVAFSPDGRLLLTGSDDYTARLWDVETGREIRAFVGHESWIHSVAFSPDGTRILTGSGDCTARLWDMETGTELQTFVGHTDWIDDAGCVTFSPDGRWVLTGSRDASARLWDAETGEQLRVFAGAGEVNSVAFSPDGRRIVTAHSGGGDNVVRIW
ncbi:MAG TPA: WD40 repeat domain-containing protein, partial [bacterium]|nr:WD40 repeat domain-containing protein [bacterium]